MCIENACNVSFFVQYTAYIINMINTSWSFRMRWLSIERNRITSVFVLSLRARLQNRGKCRDSCLAISWQLWTLTHKNPDKNLIIAIIFPENIKSTR